jgi:phosphatidylglycerol:prolipoprotein diacylglycerol transferase
MSRILVEFVRVPDEHIGYLAGGWLTEGQLLSLPMIIAGVALVWRAYHVREPSGNFAAAQ